MMDNINEWNWEWGSKRFASYPSGVANFVNVWKKRRSGIKLKRGKKRERDGQRKREREREEAKSTSKNLHYSAKIAWICERCVPRRVWRRMEVYELASPAIPRCCVVSLLGHRSLKIFPTRQRQTWLYWIFYIQRFLSPLVHLVGSFQIYTRKRKKFAPQYSDRISTSPTCFTSILIRFFYIYIYPLFYNLGGSQSYEYSMYYFSAAQRLKIRSLSIIFRLPSTLFLSHLHMYASRIFWNCGICRVSVWNV